jgi:phosphopantetheinyl transferase
MAIILHEKLYPIGEIAVWEIEDDSVELFEQLALSEIEKAEIQNMSNARKKEWVAARWLIHKLSGRKERTVCKKDSYGKPYLEDSSFQISISHSLDKVAVIASPNNVGIDIQEIVEKIERLSIKFKHAEREYWAESKMDKHILWGAKEAMYKAWGKKGIDFKEDMEVSEGEWEGKRYKSEGRLRKGGITMHFDIEGKQLEGFLLVRAVEKWRDVEE